MKNQYPHGKIASDDDGAIAVAIAADVRAGVVRIEFREPVAWIGMPRDQALAFAELIKKRAKELPQVQ